MERRERGSNYSENEKHLLFSIISNYLNQIESKKIDSVSLKEKYSTWLRITEAFNAGNDGPSRSVTQLKTAYINFKRKIKKDKANDKAELCKTGGGLAIPKKDDATLKLTELLKSSWMEPVVSEYDSSANYLASINQIGEDKSSNDEVIHVVDPKDIPVINTPEQPFCSKLTEIDCPISDNKNLKKKKRTIADVLVSISDSTDKKKQSNEVIKQKNEIEIDILKMKVERGQIIAEKLKEEKLLAYRRLQNEDEIHALRVEQEKIKFKQEEVRLLIEQAKLKESQIKISIEEEKLKQELMKSKYLEEMNSS